MKICEFCGSDFEPKCNKHYYCSTDCRAAKAREGIVMLPVAPLLAQINQAARAVQGPHAGDDGVNEISRRIAMRLDRKSSSVQRQICRMRHAKRITVQTADEFAIGLGLHPMLVWPTEWTKGVA